MEVDEDAMHFVVDPASHSPAESMKKKLDIDELFPKEMPTGGDVVDTTDATNADKDIPSEVDEDVMHFVGDLASYSPAESVKDELEPPVDDAPPEELLSRAPQEINVPPPVADNIGAPWTLSTFA